MLFTGLHVTSTKTCCTFCTLCTWNIFNKYGSTHLYTAYYVDIRRFSGHESSFKNAHTPSSIKAQLLLRITMQHINIKATICSKTSCFAKFRGTLRKNRGTIFFKRSLYFFKWSLYFFKRSHRLVEFSREFRAIAASDICLAVAHFRVAFPFVKMEPLKM